MRLTRWDQELSTENSNEHFHTLALWHLSQAGDSPQKEVISDLVSRRDHKGLCFFEFDHTQASANDAIHLRQVLALFSKRVDLDIGVDRRAVARAKFRESEDLCLRTNELFRALASGKLMLPPDVDAVLYRAQRTIAKVLGNIPTYEELQVRFGPGATTQVKKREASPRSKLGEDFACSEELFPTAHLCLEELQAWLPFGDSDTAVVDVAIHSSQLHFVPKNAKTDRVIAVEPSLNTMFQLAIGDHIARRLVRFGVDIRNQDINKSMAREGSLSGALATLDLSSASDTIALELVYHLLPLDWACFLGRFRSGIVEDDGHPIRLQKFSSMGNGFTFPLETLIFYALARASTDVPTLSSVRAYGDDIIVPTEAVPLLSRTLHCCGFILNSDKSFIEGPFRESCGGDYLSGIDIRPFYQKGPVSGATAFSLHNSYVVRDMPEAADIVLNWIAEPIRIWGPRGYGDGHLISDDPSVLRPYKRDAGWCGFIFDTFTWKTRKSFRVYKGDRVLPCYTVYASGYQPDVCPALMPHLLRRKGLYGRFTEVSPAITSYSKVGDLGVILPGRDGYKRISIYTLSTTG